MKPTKKRTLSSHALSKKLHVAVRSPQRWAEEGCPHEKDGKNLRWNLSEVQAWLEKMDQQGRPQAGQIGRPRLAAPPELLEQIRACKTLEQHEDLQREVSALLAGGAISATVGASLKALLADLRGSLKARETPAQATGEVYLDEEAAGVAARYAGILSGRRRGRVRDVLEEEALADARDFPDPADVVAVRARLAALGLDAHGEPR